MKSFTMGFRALSGVVALTMALFATSGFFPATAVCQEGNCVVSGISVDNREDGSTWVCFEEMSCDEGDVTGEDVCFKQ